MEKTPLVERTGPASPANWQAARTQAEQGNAEAQFTLGLSCSTGNGHAQDLPQAAQWYRLAADQNHTLAQFNLGLMFAGGQGVPTDHTAALHWINLAATSGDAGAQFYLGNRCHRASFDHKADNAPQLRVESYRWFSLAAAQGYKDSAAHCNRLTINMTRSEVAEAIEDLAQYSAAHPILTAVE
jgi:TPR repeat protein